MFSTTNNKDTARLSVQQANGITQLYDVSPTDSKALMTKNAEKINEAKQALPPKKYQALRQELQKIVDSDAGRELTGNAMFPHPQAREAIYIAGMTGSGKSYWINEYCIRFARRFPNRKIICFSRVVNDPTMSMPSIRRPVLDESFLDDPINPETELKDALVIFDDCDTIANKAINKYVRELMMDLLQTGRHYNISLLITNHKMTAGAKTQPILTDCSGFVFFLNGIKSQPAYFLKQYAGYSKKAIDIINSLQSRWVYVTMTMPSFIVSETMATFPL